MRGRGRQGGGGGRGGGGRYGGGQQRQQQYGGYSFPAATHFSIDVECVATGTDHNARDIAQISLVDQYQQVLLNVYVKPEKPVVSYLSPLTGMQAAQPPASGTHAPGSASTHARTCRPLLRSKLMPPCCPTMSMMHVAPRARA